MKEYKLKTENIKEITKQIIQTTIKEIIGHMEKEEMLTKKGEQHYKSMLEKLEKKET